MDRRDFVVGLGALAIAGAAEAQEHTHGAPGKAAKAPPVPPLSPLSKELRGVVDATHHCVQTGEACIIHCNNLLSSGDTSLGECQRTALNMLAVCDATFKAASYHSADPKSLKSLARVCADFCRTCAKACEPHAAHHEECHACMASCQDCAKACDAYAASA